MACPYFRPTKPLRWTQWQGKLRPPLGELYAGECAAGAEAFQPVEARLECCNLGYAAGECPCFPKTRGPDAVRFAISADLDGLIQIAYCVEQDHLPFQHGVIEYSSDKERWWGLDAGSLLQFQAEAYLKSYLKWKHSKDRAPK
jgi:hypothetical protein